MKTSTKAHEMEIVKLLLVSEFVLVKEALKLPDNHPGIQGNS